MLLNTSSTKEAFSVANGFSTRVLLDWSKRRLRVGGVEAGHTLNETMWAFLTLLAVSRPSQPGIASKEEGVIARDYLIEGRVPVRACRRELGRALSKTLVRYLIQTVRGSGYRLRPHVLVPGKSEVGLKFHKPEKLQLLDQQVSEAKRRFSSLQNCNSVRMV